MQHLHTWLYGHGPPEKCIVLVQAVAGLLQVLEQRVEYFFDDVDVGKARVLRVRAGVIRDGCGCGYCGR